LCKQNEVKQCEILTIDNVDQQLSISSVKIKEACKPKA